MQTFIVYNTKSKKLEDIRISFRKTARILDMKRLGKQRVEAMQILDILVRNKQVTWKNHPAVKQWKGSEFYLFFYIEAICNEWTKRGYKDSCLKKSFNIIKKKKLGKIIPKFLFSRKFIKSHRSNLIRKDSKFYSKYFGNLRSDLPYE